MIKAKITIFDDKTGRKFVEDQVISPSHDYRFTSLVKCYDFKFRLDVLENPFVEVIEQEKKEATKEGNAE